MLIGLLIVVAVLAVLTPVAVDRARRKSARTDADRRQAHGRRDGLAYLPDPTANQMPWSDPGQPTGGHHGHHGHHSHHDQSWQQSGGHHGHHDSGSSWSSSSGSSDFGGGGGHHHG
ncbi:hypothetical protein [Streptacidiphilus jiangxiensis]|uniref:Uncharacterized protein n=1 Tax=Streptacidiphilus jiangxiensis TaxID=235985 RepID=A0A1H7Y298_STRJI|nr:hypothetical protein [Streptacidiphilus jiangxiensis]SEM39984.1 hypothetical protein SAMN05414137_12661 [Streptacidiphilus jiangxiensis]